jgi:hypothetical protein
LLSTSHEFHHVKTRITACPVHLRMNVRMPACVINPFRQQREFGTYDGDGMTSKLGPRGRGEGARWAGLVQELGPDSEKKKKKENQKLIFKYTKK